ncbi:MAG TPA: response regulator [Ignavibacteriales bacterium]|jgi:two-component system chemotaxis response regulator CheY|nr:response regulator [Ignavibacteriales bacterium]HEX3073265.1 response regulator [Ignavibacteriales bacterium]
MKFLIVEDDFASRFILQKMLSPYGECDVAVNGIEAIDAYNLAIREEQPYDLICLDIMMPKMDGQEALKLIRQRETELGIEPKDEVKIIMVTALDTPKDVVEAFYQGGCTSYLVKPIEKKKILNILRDFELIK